MATIEFMPARLTAEETEDLRRAVACLEGTSFAQRLTEAAGRPVGMLSRAMPPLARRVIAQASEAALRGAFRLALRTLDLNAPARPANRAHKLAAAASGAVGAALACVEVFALGGQAGEEAAFESGYFAIRAALAKAVTDSARFVAVGGVPAQSAPVIARLMSQIAARFGVVVSEKLAAQAAPILGALGGAAVNAAFADHFQTLARGHFIVRRLERLHGASLVAFEYRRLRGERGRERAEGQRFAS